MSRGKKIYYDKSTGDRILELSESVYLVSTTIDQDIASFTVLSERNRDTFDVLELPYGAYAQDFAECNGYRVNTETKTLEFSYPDTNEPDVEQPYQAPLSEQINTLKEQLLTADEKYKLIDKSSISLDDLKVAKMNQLDELCNKSIVKGFDFTINGVSYRFSCSITAQANFQGTDTLFKDGLITEVEWTVIDNSTGVTSRITLDKNTFDQIRLEVFNHINANISKLRNTLQPQVESATTNSEVNSIVW